MSAGTLAFLIGLFGVPAALLLIGQKLRSRSRPVQAAFWGAAVGHVVAGALAVTWGMIPPEAWSDADVARGFAGLWALLVLPAAGAAVGAMSRANRRATN